MKLTKILTKLNDILDDDRRAQLQEIEALKVSIKRLKKKYKEFESQCEAEVDQKKKAKLQEKINIVRAQRKKGLKLLKSLREERDGKQK
jgi:phage shock protein A